MHYPKEITYYICVNCLFTFSGEELDAQEFDGVDTNKDSFYDEFKIHDEENLYREENKNNNNFPKNTRPYPIGDSVPEPIKPNYPNNPKNQEDPKYPEPENPENSKYPEPENPENQKYPDYPDYPETPVESELAQDSQAGM